MMLGEVHVSQCAGLEASPLAFSRVSFTTYSPFGTCIHLLPFVVQPSHIQPKKAAAVLLRPTQSSRPIRCQDFPVVGL